MNRIHYIAFLRGINGTGNSVMRMADLVKVFQELGYQNITSVIGSGNITFESEETHIAQLESSIEHAIQQAFNFKTVAILRTKNDITKLLQVVPFKNDQSDSTKKYIVTFLKNPASLYLKPLPHDDKQRFFIFGAYENTICSMVHFPVGTTTLAMGVFDRKFGKDISTRTWETVKKIAKALDA